MCMGALSPITNSTALFRPLCDYVGVEVPIRGAVVYDTVHMHDSHIHAHTSEQLAEPSTTHPPTKKEIIGAILLSIVLLIAEDIL